MLSLSAWRSLPNAKSPRSTYLTRRAICFEDGISGIGMKEGPESHRQICLYLEQNTQKRQSLCVRFMSSHSPGTSDLSLNMCKATRSNRRPFPIANPENKCTALGKAFPLPAACIVSEAADDVRVFTSSQVFKASRCLRP